MPSYKSMCILRSQICVNIHNCSTGWKERHSRSSSLTFKLPMKFPLHYTFCCPVWAQEQYYFMTEKNMFFMPWCQCNWKHSPSNLRWLQSRAARSPWDRAQNPSREELCSLPCPRLGKRAPLASVSPGPGSLLFPYGWGFFFLCSFSLKDRYLPLPRLINYRMDGEREEEKRARPREER